MNEQIGHEARLSMRLLEARYPERYGDGPKSEEEISENVLQVYKDELRAQGITWEGDLDLLEKWIEHQEAKEVPSLDELLGQEGSEG